MTDDFCCEGFDHALPPAVRFWTDHGSNFALLGNTLLGDPLLPRMVTWEFRTRAIVDIW